MTSVPHNKAVTAAQPLLKALQGGVSDVPPFWLMRQAGRYLPEYRALRAKAGGFLDLCFTPDFAVEVTLQPLRRFDMDAAILFSDILVIPYALGQQLSFMEGEGPQLGPLDMAALRFDNAKLAPVYETLRRLRAELPADKSLIGFSGAPWTLACYMLQGHGDGAFNAAKIFAFSQPEKFDALIALLTDTIIDYLLQQAASGADALQLFDSWAGLLPEPYFSRWVIAPAKKIAGALAMKAPGVPLIGFPRGAGAGVADYAARTGVAAVGLDTQINPHWARGAISAKTCLQGNLDPVLLLTGGKALEDAALGILQQMQGRPFIFNLGHGVIKETPPEHVLQLKNIIRGFAA